MLPSSEPSRADPLRNVRDDSNDSREAVGDALSAAGSAVAGRKPSARLGVAQKVVLARSLFRLARRYPLPALMVAAAAICFVMIRRRRRGSGVRAELHS